MLYSAVVKVEGAGHGGSFHIQGDPESPFGDRSTTEHSELAFSTLKNKRTECKYWDPDDRIIANSCCRCLSGLSEVGETRNSMVY